MSAGLCYASNTIASATAEISVVAFRVDDPIVPADSGKIDVKRITTALARAWPTVYIPRLPTDCSLGKRINDDEGFSIVVH